MNTKITSDKGQYRTWLVAAFALLVAIIIGLMITQPRNRQPHASIAPPPTSSDPQWFRFRLPAALKRMRETDQSDSSDTVDLSSEQSFPASDTPGWIRQRV